MPSGITGLGVVGALREIGGDGRISYLLASKARVWAETGILQNSTSLPSEMKYAVWWKLCCKWRRKMAWRLWKFWPSIGQTGSGWCLKFARLIPVGYPKFGFQYEGNRCQLDQAAGAELWTIRPSRGQTGSRWGLKFGHPNLSLQYERCRRPLVIPTISFKSGEILSHTCFRDLKSPIFMLDVPKG